MKTIKVSIRDKIAVAEKDALYICGNSDFVIAFDFDDEWAGYEYKTARFVFNGAFADVVFSGNECAVPVISNSYNFIVGVYAGDLHTTTPAYVAAKKSILCGNNPPAEPTPDVFRQMVELFNAGLDESRVNANAAKASEEAAAKSVVEAEQIKESAVQEMTEIKDAAVKGTASIKEQTQVLADAAKASADEARTEAINASMLADLAQMRAEAASGSAEAASGSAEAASASAVQAKTCEDNAAMMAGVAADNSNAAQNFANAAAKSEANAKRSEDIAKQSEANAKRSEDIAKQAMIVSSASGKIASVDDAAHTNILDFTVNDGTDVQTVKILGKNFFHRDYGSSVSQIGVTVEWDAENQEFILNGTTTGVGDFRLVNPLKLDWEIGENYTVSVRRVSGSAKLPVGATGTTYSWSIFSDDAKKYIRSGNLAQDFVELFFFTGKAFEAAGYILYLQSWEPGTVFDNYRVKIQIERGNTVSDWEAYREESVAFADAQSIVLQKGCNNIVAVPSADITVDYVCDMQMYIDKKIAEMKAV